MFMVFKTSYGTEATVDTHGAAPAWDILYKQNVDRAYLVWTKPLRKARVKDMPKWWKEKALQPAGRNIKFDRTGKIQVRKV